MTYSKIEIDQLTERVRGGLRNPGMFPDGAEALDSLLAAYEEKERHLNEAMLRNVEYLRELEEMRKERDIARGLAGEKQTSLVRQWRESAEAAEREVERLREALNETIETVIWMSGSSDFALEAEGHEEWVGRREKLYAAMKLRRAALGSESESD